MENPNGIEATESQIGVKFVFVCRTFSVKRVFETGKDSCESIDMLNTDDFWMCIDIFEYPTGI